MDRVVVFDLGGVLVKVAYHWFQALQKAGFDAQASANAPCHLTECKGFQRFQSGLINSSEYFLELKEFLGLSTHEEAQRVHESILLEQMPGTDGLVTDLHDRGVLTACLSNTNETHWNVMRDPRQFPVIASLKIPILSQVVQAEKPDAKIYEALESATGLLGEQVIFFDDILLNVESAQSRGWIAQQIDPDADPAAQMRAMLVDLNVL